MRHIRRRSPTAIEFARQDSGIPCRLTSAPSPILDWPVTGCLVNSRGLNQTQCRIYIALSRCPRSSLLPNGLYSIVEMAEEVKCTDISDCKCCKCRSWCPIPDCSYRDDHVVGCLVGRRFDSLCRAVVRRGTRITSQFLRSSEAFRAKRKWNKRQRVKERLREEAEETLCTKEPPHRIF